MENKANRTPKPLAISAQAACLCLGVLMLTACGRGGGGDGSAAVVMPPPQIGSGRVPTTTTTPFVVLDVVSVSTDELGASASRTLRGITVRGDGTTWADNLWLDSAEVTVDGRASIASALRNGDVALMRGKTHLTVYGGNPPHDDPWSEMAYQTDSVDAYHLVVGVIDSIDALHARLVVMGQHVSVSGDTVVNDSLVSEGALAAVQPGEMVEVSGFLTASGDVVATRIARSDSQDEFLLRGLVAATDAAAGRMRIGGLDIDYAQAAINRQDFPNGDAVVGDLVVVRADAGPTGGPLAARSVTFVPRSLSVDLDTGVTLNGIVTRYRSGDDFEIDGLTIRLDCSGSNPASQDCGSIVQDLSTDTAVQLTGVAGADGAVHAWQLSTFLGGVQSPYADGEATVVAPIGAMDAGTGALTVAGFHVQTFAHTRFVDRRGGDKSTISAEDLQIGDVVSATGSYGGTPGLLVAESIARVPLQDPQVTTYRFARAEPAITLLGRSILTTDTTRWDQCGSAADAALLFGGDVDVHYLTIGLPAIVADPVEASWVSVSSDSCQ